MRTRAVLALLTALCVGYTRAAVPKPHRQGRWFLNRGTITSQIVEKVLVTQVTPWSCVVVAPSLPPCRHVRQLNIDATPPTPIAATPVPDMRSFYGEHNLVDPALRRYLLDSAYHDPYYGDMVPVPQYYPNAAMTPSLRSGWVPLMAREASDTPPAVQPDPSAGPGVTATAAPPNPVVASVPASPIIVTSPALSSTAPSTTQKKEQGWAEWLGLTGHTITQTIIQYETTKYVDPDTVVTFSVRGCQPSKLPFDLPLCETPHESSSSPSVSSSEAPVSSGSAPAPAVEVAPEAAKPGSPAPAPPPPAENDAPEKPTTAPQKPSEPSVAAP